MRWTTIWLARTGLLNAVVRAADDSPRLRRALYGAASGHAPYRQVLGDSLAPSSMTAILSALAGRSASGHQPKTL
jgi:hypothetical protein